MGKFERLEGAVTHASAEQSHQTKGLLRLTMACNERCPFCNVPMEDYPKPTPPEDAILAELDSFVATGAQTLTLSGGEPTLLRKRLLMVTRAARARGIPFVEVQTNAVLIDVDYAREMAEAGVTSAFVSLLSDVPEQHDQLAGLDGAFPKCLAGIDALSAAGIRVTLNPVIARLTQDRLGSYVDFVATRLPSVTSISVSAVQPHGRAAKDLDLLPDYAVLAESVRHARRNAEAHGIELLNPYCGLPLCVGWEDAQDRSVEAIEALSAQRELLGVTNTGDKSHGAPCRRCALRTRCGGAWHDYWTHRAGSGIQAPIRLVPPWEGDDDAQAVITAPGGPTPALLAHRPTAPTVWLWTDRLPDGILPEVVGSGVTDIALEATPALRDDRPTLVALRRLQHLPVALPQRRQRVFALVDSQRAAEIPPLSALLVALGVQGLYLGGRYQALAEPLSRELEVDVQAVAEPRWLHGRRQR